MKLLHYETIEGSKELMKLCFKILKKNSCLIYVNNLDTGNALSEYIWRNHPFIPHGIIGEAFDSMQPLLIADRYVKRQVIINFESVFIKHDKVDSETYILWNADPYSGGFSSYKQEEGAWKTVKH